MTKMRKLLLVLSAVAALVSAAPAAAATITVAINRAGFTPNPARIDTGDTITWTNSDTRNRQVLSRSAGFASPILEPGETFSFTYRRAGRFQYEEALVEPTQRGLVVVTNPAAPPPPPPPPPAAASVTLAATSTSVVYGGAVALSGELSSGAAGEVVEVLASPSGDFVAAAATKVADVTTTTGGEFRAVVRPTARTAYRVRFKTAMSGRVTIGVRPRIGLGIVSVGRGIFTTRASSGRSYAGSTVWLQRAGRFGRWVAVKRVRLDASGRARFQARLPRGISRVRVYMTPAQAGPGYIAGMSPTRLVRR
jgi:plastocyanin